jgi:hypothetical protein
MSKEELKAILHESIENIDDDSLLAAIQEMLRHNYTTPQKPQLTEEQFASIEKAKIEINSGKYLSNDDANQIAEEWLSK